MKAVYCPYCGGRAKRNGRSSSGSQRWRYTDCGASMAVRCDDTAAGLGEFPGRLLSKDSQSTMPGGGRSFRRRTAEFWEVWPMLAPDGGGGFAKAVRESWPQTMVRRCLWHAFSQENRHTTSRPRLRAGMLRGLDGVGAWFEGGRIWFCGAEKLGICFIREVTAFKRRIANKDSVIIHHMEIEFVGSQTDCGTSKNAIRVTLDPSIAEYYNIVKNEGKLTVEKRPVTLTSASGSKEYDGKPLTNHKVTVGEAAWGTGWVDGQGATYSFTGSQKIVGSSENAFECIPNEGTNLDNYQINKTYGTLTVTDRSEKYQITLTPNSKSVTYDGTEKSVSGFETLELQINGQTFYVSGVEASATGTDAGEYPVTKSGQAVVTDAEGNDVTDQFIVNIDDAKLTIVEGDSNKSASNLPHTGDSAAPYAMGICGVAITAGAVAFVARRKGSSRR